MVTPTTPQLIALDLDETTLDRQSHLSPGNRAALEAAISMGTQIVIASGRSLDTLPQEMTHFPGIRYAICGNGAMVYDLAAQRILVQHFLPAETAREILRLSQGEFLTYEGFVDGCAYAQEDYVNRPTDYLCGENSAAYIQSTRRPVPDIAAFLVEHETRLDSLDIVVGNLQAKETMMQRLMTPFRCVHHQLRAPSHRDFQRSLWKASGPCFSGRAFGHSPGSCLRLWQCGQRRRHAEVDRNGHCRGQRKPRLPCCRRHRHRSLSGGRRCPGL